MKNNESILCKSIGYIEFGASRVAHLVKNLPEVQEAGFSPWVGTLPWRRAQQPTPVFLPRESHGQRSLMGYSPWGHRESDTVMIVVYL